MEAHLKKLPEMSFNVLGVIPARMNSSRFPGKPLKNILNKPMIQWVYENSRRSQLLNDLVVATDSQEILNAVKQFGGSAIMTNENHLTGLDRVIEVSEKLDNFTHYVNIQGDEPAIHPDTINGIVQTLKEKPGCQIATAAIAFQKMENFLSPHQVKVVFDNNNKALYFSRSPIPYRESQSDLSFCYKHLGIYGYDKNTLGLIKKLPPGNLEQLEKLEQLRMLENNLHIYIYITQHDSVGVDTPEDIARVEAVLS